MALPVDAYMGTPFGKFEWLWRDDTAEPEPPGAGVPAGSRDLFYAEDWPSEERLAKTGKKGFTLRQSMLIVAYAQYLER